MGERPASSAPPTGVTLSNVTLTAAEARALRNCLEDALSEIDSHLSDTRTSANYRANWAKRREVHAALVKKLEDALIDGSIESHRRAFDSLGALHAALEKAGMR